MAIRLTVAALAFYSPSLLRAEDNTSTIISGTVFDNGGADFYVGNTGTNNYLEINSGGVLTNVGAGYVGHDTGASNNAVLVTGTDSVWYNTGAFHDLYIGGDGSSNTLTIAAGGRVEDSRGTIGASGGNNAVLVTGTNSVWNNSSYFWVGHYSSGNTLTIANGGAVSNGDFAWIGLTGNNNGVLVTGAKSVWNIHGGQNTAGVLFVGSDGDGNTLTIADGGTVYSTHGYIGYGTGASNGVLVTDSGSVWNTSGGLYVGNYGSGNTLTIAASGTVYSAGSYIGYDTGASNNAVTVTDSGSDWNSGGGLIVGYSGSSNTLTIANGGTVSSANGSIGLNSSASNNAVIVTGPDSVWNNPGDLYVGNYGSGNTLTITNGGVVNNGWDAYGAVIGWNTDANNNAVTVTGPGSVWHTTAFGWELLRLWQHADHR
ncbi:MAG: hypothetical protein NTV49_12285 [Kiritimatiellaeota bacterium]|nr:hypothetical protein [Kiritimatiellota bacterium]